MHMHSSYSDGEYDPNTLIEKCIENGLTTISITDHENMHAYNNIDYDRFINRIELYRGIELTAKVNKGRLHILGYDCDYKNIDFIKKCDEIKMNSFYSMINLLNQIRLDYGIRFTPEEIRDIFNANHNIGRPDIASLLLKNNYVNSTKEAFNKYLNPSYDKIRQSNVVKKYDECISIIKNAGGIPVLAHPNQLYLNDDELFEFVKKLVDSGLEGIEVYHSGHTKEEISYYLDLSRYFNLIISGGSDFHGPIVKPSIELGKMELYSSEIVDVLRKRKSSLTTLKLI